MFTRFFQQTLLAAAVIPFATLVNASPYVAQFNNPLRARDLALSKTCTAWLVGQKDTGSQVCIEVSGTNLIVAYPAVLGCTYNSESVYIGTTPPSATSAGQYTNQCTNTGSTVTCSIPVSKFGKCNTKLYIATHASLTCSGTLSGSQTGWGKGTCVKQPSCNPWGQYWEFTPQCYCPVTITQAVIHSTEIDYITSVNTSYVTAVNTSYATSVDTSYTTNVNTSYITSVDTSYTTNVNTSYITSVDTSYATSVNTSYITAVDTSYSTTIDTIYITSVNTSYSTSVETDYITNVDTSYSTSVDTDYITNVDTSYSTSVETDYITSIATNYITSVATNYITSVATSTVVHAATPSAVVSSVICTKVKW